MTEEEANQKWCPFSRVENSDAGEPQAIVINRFDDGSPASGSYCIASDCAVWCGTGFCGLINGN